jgi:putative ABC transport system permease protein
MGVPVLRGRGIERTDRVGSNPVAVVNETFVRENFPAEDPLGRRFTLSIDFGFGSPVWEIVGVVGDVRSRSVTTEPRAEVYVPLAHTGVNTMMIHVRGRRGAAPLFEQLRAQVLALDANLPLASVETVSEAVGRAVAPTRFFLSLVGGFALMALLLAAVGLYGVVSYHVAQRTREIGLRMALGAQPRRIVRSMVGEAMRPTTIGILIGLAAALAVGSALESLLFQVHSRDPLTLLLAPALLVPVVGLASLVPAWRAARVDPVTALREE